MALSAFIAGRTGNAADFFLPGLLINLAYGLAFAVSNVARWPLVGLGVGAATGDLAGWRKDPELRRAYVVATWLWAAMFVLRPPFNCRSTSPDSWVHWESRRSSAAGC